MCIGGSNKDRKITLEELSKHRTPGDAWLSYKGKVYDVSNWNTHPGGSVIFTHAGDDCTDIFAAFHPASAWQDLQRFEIGVLDETAGNMPPKSKEQKEFEKGYRELRHKLVTMGMFKSNKLYYLMKFITTTMILAASAFFAIISDSLPVNLIGALLMGLFWQQCGWLAHDFLHHAVFTNRVYGDMMGLIIGNLYQGFSVQWWKSKHNTHHAVPNLHASVEGACDGDPDIDTMPYLAWTKVMAESAKTNDTGKFLIQWQAYIYFPLLHLARLSWAHQSWVFIFGGAGQHSVPMARIDQQNTQYPTIEKIFLILHYTGLFYLLSHMPVINAVIFFFVAQMSCGFMLALVFGLGHNGMAVYPADQRPDFWKLQVSTTRNVKSTPFVDWFFGGLQYQVDHHLFPSLPRHNFGKVHKYVEAFCKEHDVRYHETNIMDGTWEVLGHLNKISAEFMAEFPAL